MKKLMLFLLVASLGGCTTQNARMANEAKDICEHLGYEKGTKDFRDCTVAQFNRSRDKYVSASN